MDHVWAPAEPAQWDDLQKLFDLVIGEVISEAEALRSVRQTRFDLSDDVISEATASVIEFARGEYLRQGYQLASLLLGAAEQAPSPGRRLWRTVASAYLEAATEMFADRQDMLLFQRARDIAARLVSESALPLERGLALVRAGSLRLEGYAANPIFDSYASTMVARHKRRYDPSQEMTDGLDMLRAAAALFSEAAGLLEGAQRGFALAQNAYAQMSLAHAGDAVAPEEILATCREAWPLLTDEPLGEARVRWALARIGASGQVPFRHLVLPPVNYLIRRYGIRLAVATVAVPIRLDFSGAAEVSTDLAAQLLTSMPSDRLEMERRWLALVPIHHLPDDPLDCSAAAIIPSLSQLRETSSGSAWSPRQFEDAAFHVMAHSAPGPDTDLADLDIIGNLEPMDRSARGLADRVAARWSLLAGISRQKAGDLPGAASIYLRSAVHHARLGYTESALGCLDSVLQCLVKGHPDVALATVPALADAVDLLTALLADHGGGEALNNIFRQCFTRISELAETPAGPTDSTFETVLLLTQIAKGRVFSAAQAAAGPLVDDAFVSRVIDTERTVAALLGDRSGAWSDPRSKYESTDVQFFDDEAVLGAYLDVPEIQDGGTLAEAQANIRRRYQRLDGVRTAIYAARGSRLLTRADLLSLMTTETVLVTLYYAGVGEPPREGFHSLVCATDQPGYYLSVYDSSRPSIPSMEMITLPAEAGAAQTRIKYVTAGIHTAYTRRVLAEDPLFQPLSREAREGLSAAAGHFGPLLDLLVRFQAAGKRHLVVWPHGPQYLLPFHLLPTESGRVLADDWTVTITPSLQCLIGARRAEVRSPVLAVASAQGGVPYGLPAEPSVAAQAEAVAAAFGAAPIVGATRESFCTMAQGARYIHIAAHGAQYLPAPTFNCVYLDDGPLYAHEILKLDLRGVDLVTLSACQSALIRYDINDNLHGLPAAFLRAGAACVVGTLWPVTPAAAQDFFSALYGRIAAGDGKLAAFRTAQRAARDRHPQHRDWGAFSMLGAWQERPAQGG